MKQKKWTPKVVEDRQQQLLEILYENWDIQEA